LLAKEYGFSKTYTPAQIKRTIERSGLSTDYGCYALSIFSDQLDFVQYHQALGEVCDYGAMRAEIAALHFHGNAGFSVTDMPGSYLQALNGAESHAGPGHHGDGVEGVYGGF
jgi:hypothetical protein